MFVKVKILNSNKYVYVNEKQIITIEQSDFEEGVCFIRTVKETFEINKPLEEVLKMLDSSESIV